MNGKLILKTSEYQTIEYDLKNCVHFENIPLKINGEMVSNGLQLIAQLASKEFKTKQELEKQNKINELREERETIIREMEYSLIGSYFPLENRLFKIDEKLFELESCQKITEKEWNRMKEDHREHLYHYATLPCDLHIFVRQSVSVAFYKNKNPIPNELIEQITLERTDKIGTILISVPKSLDLVTVKRCAEVVKPFNYAFEYKHLAE